MKLAISRILGAATLFGLAAQAAAPALAQQLPGVEETFEYPYTAPSDEALAFAQERGALLFAYDQAAWHSTDAFLTQFDAEALGPHMRGYVIERTGAADVLDAVYYGDFGDGLVEVARYSVSGEEVTGGGLHPADARPALSASTLRLVNARQAVIGALSQTQVTLCANAQANTIAVPNGDGVDVYVMTPLTDTRSIPLGGHYRFSVDASGQLTQLHRLEEGCPRALLPELTADTDAVVLTPVEYIRAPEPSEIHVWASMMRPVPLFVDTPRSRSIWVVDQGSVRAVTEDDFSDAPPDDLPAE